MWKRLVFGVVLTLLLPFVADSSGPQESPQQIEVRLIPGESVIHPGDRLGIKVEIWNVGLGNVIIPQNLSPVYMNSALKLYLETSSGFQGSNAAGAVDGFPNLHPDVTKTFVTTWLTLREGHYYGTVVYMDPREYPQLRKLGHYRVKAEYISGGISSAFASNGARLNQEDIERLPFKAWAGTVYSNLLRIQVSGPIKQNSDKKKIADSPQ
jgi:hypothetical protein